jgi:hypothetical protein
MSGALQALPARRSLSSGQSLDQLPVSYREYLVFDVVGKPVARRTRVQARGKLLSDVLGKPDPLLSHDVLLEIR